MKNLELTVSENGASVLIRYGILHRESFLGDVWKSFSDRKISFSDLWLQVIRLLQTTLQPKGAYVSFCPLHSTGRLSLQDEIKNIRNTFSSYPSYFEINSNGATRFVFLVSVDSDLESILNAYYDHSFILMLSSGLINEDELKRYLEEKDTMGPLYKPDVFDLTLEINHPAGKEAYIVANVLQKNSVMEILQKIDAAAN